MSVNNQRLPLMRAELSSNFDGGETSQIFSIRYDPGQGGDSRLRPGIGAEDLVSSYPMIIYDYKMEVACDTLCQLYQTYSNYADTAEENASYLDWNMSSRNFLSSLKQHKLIAGHTTGSMDTEGPNEYKEKVAWKTGTLYYRAKGYWSKRHKEWRWTRPPIILSKNKKNYFGLQIANVGQSTDRSFYATVTIKKWGQLI